MNQLLDVVHKHKISYPGYIKIGIYKDWDRKKPICTFTKYGNMIKTCYIKVYN